MLFAQDGMAPIIAPDSFSITRLVWVAVLCLALNTQIRYRDLLIISRAPAPAVAQGVPQSPTNPSILFLPLVEKYWNAVSNRRRINMPYFSVADISTEFSQMGLFWFGRVDQTNNYADVRVGYNNAELYVYVAVFDRRLWSNPYPTPATLTAWDSVSLYLRTTGNTGIGPDANSYRFDAGLYDASGGAQTGYNAAYRGTGQSWISATVPFSTLPGWRGNAMNANVDGRGWTMTFQFPFTSTLAIEGMPADGTQWGLGVVVHNRDDLGGTIIGQEHWPEGLDVNGPGTWGNLSFGLPTYAPPASTPGGSATIRQGLNGATVPDAAVGGTLGYLCPGDSTIWTDWGNKIFAGATGFNIQNEADISDWPCFSKYYVTFPLDQVPANKVVVSATLTLHQWGNSGLIGVVVPSLIQVMSIAEDWNPTTITWNNSPMALENVSQAWVPAEQCGALPQWPCAARSWDVSRAAAQAYSAGQPLRLALYSADSAYSSGKFFTSSGTQDWNAAGRPTLQVTWGNP